MRRTLTWGLAALAAAALAGPAGTTPPTREFVPADDFTIEGICAFDVEVEILMNKEFFTVFSDGRGLITGAFKVRLTNAGDPSKTLDLNIPGPGTFTESPDGLMLQTRGPWLLFFFPGDLGPGTPGVLRYVAGRSTITVGADGISLVHEAGLVRDLCPELA